MCKSKWVESHSCSKTFGELDEDAVTSLDAIVDPHVYPEVNEGRWNCDSYIKTTANGMKSTFVVVVCFVGLNNSLNYLKSLSAELQTRDVDVFEAYAVMNHIKSEIQCLRDDIGVDHQRWYDETKQLARY